jgi:hypothetical protein
MFDINIAIWWARHGYTLIIGQNSQRIVRIDKQQAWFGQAHKNCTEHQAQEQDTERH